LAFLPSIGISISFWPDAASRGYFADFASAASLPTRRRSASRRRCRRRAIPDRRDGGDDRVLSTQDGLKTSLARKTQSNLFGFERRRRGLYWKVQ
jgi:hypothetical protein